MGRIYSNISSTKKGRNFVANSTTEDSAVNKIQQRI